MPKSKLGKGGLSARTLKLLPKVIANIDKKQNKRIAALEKANRAAQGWIDSRYNETTMNRNPQEISRGVQDSAAGDTEFFVMAQDTDSVSPGDDDHKRIGLSIKARRIRAHITISGRGSTAGYPPDSGAKSGSNQVRLLGVCYKTVQDYNDGLAEVLQYSDTSNDARPAQAINSFFKKQSTSNWRIWCDKVFSVPYTTQTKRLVINYKVPDALSKMVYPSTAVNPPDTNIFVLYAMTGVRDNGDNTMTLQATYRCTYDK
jgi:hypothetical protein